MLPEKLKYLVMQMNEWQNAKESVNGNVAETYVTTTVADDDINLIDDYLAPAMNYKDGASCKSPPIVTVREACGHGHQTWNTERDDISLYGTPKEELGPGISVEVKGPSFMRSQIEALFQPSGK